jgi:hypothetical protein
MNLSSNCLPWRGWTPLSFSLSADPVVNVSIQPDAGSAEGPCLRASHRQACLGSAALQEPRRGRPGPRPRWVCSPARRVAISNYLI